MWILFEGQNLEKNKVKEVWREGPKLYCDYNGDIVLLNHYSDEVEAELGLKYLLYRLGRASGWI
jgi:hypothetical protein